MIQSLKDQITLYSDINVLRSQHRKKFIILRNVISALREEFNPVSPERIGESIDDLLDVTSKYANYYKKHNDVLNPILCYSGLALQTAVKLLVILLAFAYTFPPHKMNKQYYFVHMELMSITDTKAIH